MKRAKGTAKAQVLQKWIGASCWLALRSSQPAGEMRYISYIAVLIDIAICEFILWRMRKC